VKNPSGGLVRPEGDKREGAGVETTFSTAG